MGVEAGVLGEMAVRIDRRRVDLGPAKQRGVLAALVVDANKPVSSDLLVHRVWGAEPPLRAAGTLRTYLSRLRGVLAASGWDGIHRAAGGYVIELDEMAVDLLRFRHLVAEARSDGGADAANLFEEALELWRGDALADLDTPWAADMRRALDTERFVARLDLHDARLRQGRHAELLADLAALASAHPLDERVAAQYLTTLYRSGRQAEALTTYDRIRRRLADELGADPGPALQQLHQQIMTGDRAVLSPARGSGDAAGSDPGMPRETPVVLRQLPAAPAGFTGRATELSDLDTVSDMTAVVITAIDGMAGVGKTALTIHAAHCLALHYPDGQIFLDLHGYTRGRSPVEPDEALDRILRALGVRGDQIPSGLDDRAALYRHQLADRKILILLDNAVSESQVEPLLPGTPGCLVLVTSRRRLDGLDRTHTVSLDVLPQADAVALFVHTAGRARVGGEPHDQLAKVVELCGRLPLAIRIAAARLRSRPSWTTSHLLERLRLTELKAGPHSVMVALDLSYHQLLPDEQRAYRLLGLHPGVDVDAHGVAALTRTTDSEAEQLVGVLLDAHLLQEQAAGRYRFHDLVRSHAALTAESTDTTDERAAAVDRLLDHYRRTASGAIDVAYPYDVGTGSGSASPGSATPGFDDQQQAEAWLDVESDNLLAAAAYAAGNGRPDHTVQQSAVLKKHLRIRGMHSQAGELHERAVGAARTTGNRDGEVRALINLGDVHRLQSRTESAATCFTEALDLARGSNDRAGELDALIGLGDICYRDCEYERGARLLSQAISIARELGDDNSEHRALIGLGQVHRTQGAYGQTVDCFAGALDIARRIGNREGEIQASNRLGEIHLMLGDLDAGAAAFGQAADAARATRDRPGEMTALTGLAWALRENGEPAAAARHCELALEIARFTGSRTGELGALLELGHSQRASGHYERAGDRFDQMLEVARTIGDPNGEFEALQGRGRVELAQGRPEDALASHRQALEIVTDIEGQLPDQARAHDGIAHAHRALNHVDRARGHWQQAHDILTDLRIDQTEETEVTTGSIRAHLEGVDA